MDQHEIKSPKKLIEVALPLDAINKACAREKSIRHGHPSTLHLWWARRPLAAARAVIFSQLVHDPEDLWYYQNPGKEPNKQVRGHWTKARARLFKIIEDLVLWENTTNEEVLNVARADIRKSWTETCELNRDHPNASELFDPEKMPGLHDPFAGGGTIPLEAQRLGLEAYASDLNPVAVLINKAMIEIPPKFAGMPPVNPESRADKQLVEREWKGAEGLAEDVRYYGKWIRDEAEKRIGHLYPTIDVTDELIRERKDLERYSDTKLTPIAYIWARTVRSPDPAFAGVHVPLATTFVLSKKPGKQSYVVPVKDANSYYFKVVTGTPDAVANSGTTAGKRAAFRCLMSGSPVDYEYIRREGVAGRLGQKLLAVVAEGQRERVYLSPTEAVEQLALGTEPTWKPDGEFEQHALGFRVGNYGITKWSQLFTKRQLVALSCFSDLIRECRSEIAADLEKIPDDSSRPSDLMFAQSYADAVAVYLAFALDKSAVYWNSLCPWLNQAKNEIVGNSFSRQTVQMVWDFAEANPLSSSGGNIDRQVEYIAKVLVACCTGSTKGIAIQGAAASVDFGRKMFVSTDPPYYDNIGYADLSDFFYVWLRRSLRDAMPGLFATIATPKEDELVATPCRHGGRESAESFFLSGMTRAIELMSSLAHPSAPLTIYYAFKQADTNESATSSTGWETFLAAIIDAGLSICGTWPMRTERPGRMRDQGSNALASSVILVCRHRNVAAVAISRREFIRELNATLPLALDAMTRESEDLPSPVAPVDLSQAVIGPGMAVFSKYSAVLEADGSPMTVRTALQLINRFLAEDDFDADTQFCLHWFDQYGWEEGIFGEADVLARAKATSVSGLVDAGVLRSGSGKVQLLRPADYSADWNPQKDLRIPIWEVLHQLIRALRQGGESAAGKLLGHGNVQSRSEAARQLAYRLYTLCERKNWSEDARAYNELITSWTNIESATPKDIQTELF